MRILIVSQHYWPSLGGAEVMLRRLADEWTALGCSVVVLTGRWNDEWPAEEVQDGVRIVRHPVLRTRWLGTFHYVRTLQRWLSAARDDFDAVYVSMLKHAAWNCARTGEQVGLPVILRAEGAGATGDMAWQNGALFGTRIRRTCQRAAAFVAPGAAIQQEMLAAGYDPERLYVIPNGVPIPSEPWRRDQTSHFRSQCGLPDRTTFVFTGRLHEGKGLTDLLVAAASLRGRLDLQVVLVGDGPERQSLAALAERQGIADRVVFAGQVDDVTPWLRASNAYVLPSYEEGLSVALLEALALGMPSIASDIAANRGILPMELLPLFPIKEPSKLAAAMQGLVEARQENLDEQRRLTVDQFGIASVARRHLELFNGLRGGR